MRKFVDKPTSQFSEDETAYWAAEFVIYNQFLAWQKKHPENKWHLRSTKALEFEIVVLVIVAQQRIFVGIGGKMSDP